MNEVTLVITSCNRNDLLVQTLNSFFRNNTYHITKTIIIDDSGIGNTLDWSLIEKEIPVKYEIICNARNLGQISSIDIAYSKVDTDFIFHCEEDWAFYTPGFIEKSFEILNNDTKIFTVWLRAHTDTKNHPIIFTKKYKIVDDYYYLMEQYHKKVWCGFTFNPGLRRTSDCMRLHPYSELKVRELAKKNNLEIMHEMDLSIYYQELGYRGAITSNANGYVRHIGGKRHIPLPWQIK